jgi:gas vesicle protein
MRTAGDAGRGRANKEAFMADGYDRFENEPGGGGSFIIGLLTGTVLGAGLGMLFAPKAGTDLRNQISEQAGNIRNTATESYRKASETASDLADRGRRMYGRARDAVNRGAEEAQRYTRDAVDGGKDGVDRGRARVQDFTGPAGTTPPVPGVTPPMSGSTRTS